MRDRRRGVAGLWGGSEVKLWLTGGVVGLVKIPRFRVTCLQLD